MRAQCNTKPNKFEFNKVGSILEIALNENITEEIVENEIHFTYDTKQETLKDLSKDNVISSYIHLKYHIDKEISLINKGILDAENVEYLAYRDFVNEVKIFVEKENVYD